MKRVALVQSYVAFTEELKKKYLGDIPLLTSTDASEIYGFIKKCANNKCIFKFVLHIDSGVLSSLIDYIYDRKNESVDDRVLLSKCILIATYSNADTVRDKNVLKNTNIYFSLSPLSKILKIFDGIIPNRVMLIVSDSNTPYYNQVYSTNIIPKYRVAEITLEKINEFTKTGSNITLSLRTLEEYQKVINLISQSTYTRQISVIEKNYADTFKQIENKVSSITASSSGVGICGNTDDYIGLNQYTLYDITATVLINTYKFWDKYIQNNIISIKSPNYNVIYRNRK